MRRSTTRALRHRRSGRASALTALALVAGLAVLSPSPSTAADGHGAPAVTGPGHARAVAAQRALDRARSALSGTPVAQTPGADRPDATMALRDLAAALPDLAPSSRAAADRILARPTSPGDNDAYTVPSKHECGGHFCVHWVTSTADKAPSQAWVDLTLKTMNSVWNTEVNNIGYHAPAADGTRGGNKLVDVYLKDIGNQGLYGYTQPERTLAVSNRRASGYLVLDNDFARSQFDAAPQDSLRVTAAHEFFHLVQFNYDYLEDYWFMEATATWMEERVYDSINDNRQYLTASQVRHPETPLDLFSEYDSQQYGNWAFFEFLSSRYGRDVVRTAWYDASDLQGAPHEYSIRAVASALAPYGSLKEVYARFVGANTHAADAYSEGAAWPTAPMAQSWTMSSTSTNRSSTQTIDHLAAADLRARPGTGMGSSSWHLRVTLDTPNVGTSPAVLLTVDRTGSLSTLYDYVPLDSTGAGTATVPFGSDEVVSVTVSLVNASTRYTCGQYTYYSCEGTPTDENKSYQATLNAFQA